MKVSSINNNLMFNGKIIDAHMHVGNWQGTTYNIEHLDTFSKQPLSNGDTIEKMIVSNGSCIEKNGMKNELNGNIEMLKMAESSQKIAPLAVCQPKTGSVDNITKLFNENPNKFVGLKFHPDAHEIMASSDLFTPYLKFAEKKNLPCLFHCGIGWSGDKLVDESLRYSAPDEIYKSARRIPKTPVILAHLGAGGEKVHPQAIKALLDSINKKDANLFADISWVDIDNPQKPTIIELIQKLKEKNSLHKILFGSDAPIGEFQTGKNGLSGKEFYDKTVVDIKSAIKNNFSEEADDIIDKIFYKNADNLFFKKTRVNKVVEPPKAISKSKIFGIALVGFAAIATLCALGKKYYSQNKAINNSQPEQKTIVA